MNAKKHVTLLGVSIPIMDVQVLCSYNEIMRCRIDVPCSKPTKYHVSYLLSHKTHHKRLGALRNLHNR